MGPQSLAEHLNDPDRLAALHAVALLDSSSEEAFDRLSRLAARLLDAPVALVSLVDADRQFFKSCVGLEAEPWASDRQTPLSHSFCQHNRIAGQPLIIEDARTHPVVGDNLAIRDLDVVAYLGFPLATADGHVLGSFCAIDNKPRTWDADDVEIIRDLAAAVMGEIQLRTEVATRQRAEGERDELNRLNSQLRSEISARQIAEEQQKALEAQLNQTRKIDAIGQLAGGIAHDLNNLLTPILIYTSILLDDDELSDSHSEIIDQIQSTGLSARDLIRQLLTFSRMQAMEFTVIDVNDVVENLGRLLRRTVREDIQMSTKLAPDLDPIMGDANQIEQIVMNLVVNAADAMPTGGELHIATAMAHLGPNETRMNKDAKPGPYALLTVTDTGDGMNPETQERVFEPFFSTKGTDGTGLGLATVLGIVLQHGGVVHSDSQVDQGTTFKVYLPVTYAHPENDIRNPDHVSRSEHAATILLAEDDHMVRDLIHRILQTQGYTVLSAPDGEQALRLLANADHAVDLLLTDVVMSGMNGSDLYQQALKQRADLRVLFMSGYTNDIIANRGVVESGTHFIAKPFMQDELLAKVAEVIAIER